MEATKEMIKPILEQELSKFSCGAFDLENRICLKDIEEKGLDCLEESYEHRNKEKVNDLECWQLEKRKCMDKIMKLYEEYKKAPEEDN